MSGNDILAIAQAGMQTGMSGLRKNALNLAGKETIEAQSTPVEELVEMKMNQYQVLASGKIIEITDEMLGSLLDEEA